MKETSLPDNAFRPLKEGEEYEPLMKPNQQYREVTPWSLVWGLLMAVVFSAATAYLGLKVGQVFNSHYNYCRRRKRCHTSQSPLGRKRDYSEHRCMFGYDCGWRHLYTASTLYFAA